MVIIGGAAEGFALARALPDAPVHLPTRERVTRDWPVAPSTGPVTPDLLTRLGLEPGAGLVVEAAHPCDSDSAFAVARACAALGIAHLQLVRPGWRASRLDRWVMLDRARDAARVIPRGSRVLVTTGRAVLPDLRALDAYVLARRIGSGGRFPLRRGRFVPGMGPFSVAQEIALLRKERIDWLLVHDAGGPGGWPKLAAARCLGLPVALLRRPARPAGPRVETVAEALAWLNTRNG